MADRNIRDFLHNSLLKGELFSILFLLFSTPAPPRVWLYKINRYVYDRVITFAREWVEFPLPFNGDFFLNLLLEGSVSVMGGIGLA